MRNNLGIEKIKEIASKITEERNSGFHPLTPMAERIQTYAEDETYEVRGNYIVGVNIAVDDFQFIIRKTVEREIFEIYADDSENGEYGAINVDSRGNMENIAEFLNQHFNIQFYDVKLSAIGSFYKPNNNSKLNQLDDNDMETLVYLLEFLKENKIIKEFEYEDYDLKNAIIKWDTIQI